MPYHSNLSLLSHLRSPAYICLLPKKLRYLLFFILVLYTYCSSIVIAFSFLLPSHHDIVSITLHHIFVKFSRIYVSILYFHLLSTDIKYEIVKVPLFFKISRSNLYILHHDWFSCLLIQLYHTASIAVICIADRDCPVQICGIVIDAPAFC